MPTYRLPPGAWIERSLQSSTIAAPASAGLNAPPGRWGSALNPPTGLMSWAGLNPPTGLQRRAALNPPTLFAGLNPPTLNGAHNAADAAQVLNLPEEWSGTDPAWVYAAGPEALLATALRKVQAKIIRPSDPRVPTAVRGAQARQTSKADPLWRWEPVYRIQALVCEMLGRCIVSDAQIWHVAIAESKGQKGLPSLKPTEIFSIKGPASSFDYSIQIDKVLRAAIEREDRLPEILSQANDIVPFFEAITGLNSMAAPKTAELMQVGWAWATHLLMRLKHGLAELRPYARSSLVQPVIATPGHGSLPSGHATISALYSRLFAGLLYAKPNHPRASQLDRLARRIAFNRVVAGVHFPMDSYAGYSLGRQLAELFIALAEGSKLPSPVVLNIEIDSELTEVDELPTSKNSSSGKAVEIAMLRKMWSAAQLEISDLRI